MESHRVTWGGRDTWEVALVTLRVTWSDMGTLGRWHWGHLESMGVA